jgi:hypothetical protein
MRIPLGTLDKWINTYKTPSAKRGGARVFSLQDIVILQTARKLLSPNILARRALSIASDLIHDPPDVDATLYVPDVGGPFLAGPDDWPDANFTCVHPGWIAEDISRRLEPR